MINIDDLNEISRNSIEKETLILLSEAIYKYEKTKENPVFLQHMINDDDKVTSYVFELFKDIGWSSNQSISKDLLLESFKLASQKQITSEENLNIDQYISLKEKMSDDSSRKYEFNNVPIFLYQLMLGLINTEQKNQVLNSYAENSSLLYLLDKFHFSGQAFYEIPNKEIALNFYLFNYLFELKQNEFRVGEPLLDPPYVENNRLMQFDAVVSAPPFDKLFYLDYIKDDLYQRFDKAELSVRDSTTAHILHVLSHLNEKGKAAILVHGSPLFQTGRRGSVREYLLEKDYVEGVIALPTGLLRNTSIQTFILILNKEKKAEMNNKVKFYDASTLYETKHKNRELNENHIEQIIKTYSRNDKNTKATIVDVHEVIENESILNPMSYLIDNDIKIDGFGLAKVDKEKYKNLVKQPLESFCEVITGGNIKKADDGELIKTINGKALQDETIKLNEIEEVLISNKKAIQRSIIKPNDILMLSRGVTPKFAIANEFFDYNEVYATSNLFILRPKNNVNPAFIQAYLSSPFGLMELSKVQKGTTIPMFTAKAIKQLPVPKVDDIKQTEIHEQYIGSLTKYQNVVKEAKKELYEARVNIYEQMGLMNTIQKN